MVASNPNKPFDEVMEGQILEFQDSDTKHIGVVELEKPSFKEKFLGTTSQDIICCLILNISLLNVGYEGFHTTCFHCERYGYAFGRFPDVTPILTIVKTIIENQQDKDQDQMMGSGRRLEPLK